MTEHNLNGASDAQHLTFAVAGETYALAIEGIKEIIELSPLTVVPMMPAYLRGVINLRGAVVPVIDLAARFGQPPSQVGRRSCVVILELANEQGERQVFGLLVDAVCAVLDIAREQMEPAPAFGAPIRTDFIAGMARLEERFVVVLDAQNVLAAHELAQVVQAGSEAAA
ncbi:chemotaxis protein CheW [Pseudomonas sp. KNUC1026]|uniref:chemotaxis protein CheW n=1 Tax=Pseudomonas sp. KNUC1026 TaxID=2893890 RepID=UPI001F355FBD|nr:chemotaxis protein CheW [Pseudomonas sp. KNUC1026]UFH50057.1 chemotaxis protein CheW [Pseudomonas sp. KNUC1026]